ncbi:hypothetical protein [Micromonospora sagamiensis]|uniref:HEAT repeat protein n=1 Tax=Micromonospora sagamiensis TaxID=47875 RepID=A0A562WQ68_9ACTN|nr:hypothetical protein [Micromonospora sagamiensis]TWJ31947.1 hypothetical protein JD81_05513 [Micromonospora sagamiensis]BCL14999.1 hypothetical protein GCM10017556_27380 [Micromonospora sagamiensis]
MWRRKRSQIERDAEQLAGTDTVAFAGVGFAARILPETEAYRRLEAALPEHPDEVRARVDWLLEHGSPAGRAYAATLLEEIDPVAARTAWRRLADSDGEFVTFAGCIMGHRTLREYATEQLAAE